MIQLQQEQLDYFKKSETQNREFLAGIEKQRQIFVEDMEKRQKDDEKKDKENNQKFFLELAKIFPNSS